MPAWFEPVGFRRCALAVSVLDNIDVEPANDGLVLPGNPPLRIRSRECRRALAGADPDEDEARRRLARWLRLRRWVADCPVPVLANTARPYGVPVESPLHPGLDWVRARIPGDSLDLGLAFAGLNPDLPDDVVVVPESLLEAAGVFTDAWWTPAAAYLEQMGRTAAERFARDTRAPLRPMGDCDVVTLLGSRALRTVLVSGLADGMRAVAVPMRTRGWADMMRIDPAYSLAAAALTDDEHRGFPRPLLVTRDEVVMVCPGGKPAEIVLRDPATERPGTRPVLYH